MKRLNYPGSCHCRREFPSRSGNRSSLEHRHLPGVDDLPIEVEQVDVAPAAVRSKQAKPEQARLDLMSVNQCPRV